MKLFVKGKVYEVDECTEHVVVEQSRSVMEYRCLGEIEGSGGATVHQGTPSPTEMRVEMDLVKNCCTKPMHTFFAKKFFKSKPFKITFQLANKQEMSGKIAISAMNTSIEMDNTIMIHYEAIFIGELEIITPIDWSKVENEGKM